MVKTLILVLSYSAKILGVFIIMFFVLSVWQEWRTIINMASNEFVLSIFFLMIMLGVVLGWFYELIGGIFMIAGFSLFLITHLLTSGKMMSGPYFWIFPALGAVYILSWWLRKKYLPDF